MAEIIDLDTLDAFIAMRSAEPSTEPVYVSIEAMAAIIADPRIITALSLKGRSFRWKNVPILVKPPAHRPVRP